MTPVSPISAAQEAERLRALAPYLALGRQHNPVFEELAQLTARLFAVPMAQVSLVGAEEVLYPGNAGYPPLAERLPRADSICAVAVYQPGPTVYPNLRAQPCHWLRVEAQQDFVFYASSPIITTEGQAIGSLCVLDTEPREFERDDQLLLQQMAALAMRLLDLELAAPLVKLPLLWSAIESRVRFSLQRIETLAALARWETSADTPAARAYSTSLHSNRLRIVEDIEYQIKLLGPTADDRPGSETELTSAPKAASQ